MPCPICRKEADIMLAVIYEGDRYHRSCLVQRLKKVIVSLEKKMTSPGISQINHAVSTRELDEKRLDLKAAERTYQEEKTDKQQLGKIMIRRGFGARVDTHKLLERGEVTKKQIDRAAEIKELYE